MNTNLVIREYAGAKGRRECISKVNQISRARSASPSNVCFLNDRIVYLERELESKDNKIANLEANLSINKDVIVNLMSSLEKATRSNAANKSSWWNLTKSSKSAKNLR